ncbi:hypothetical protein P3T36_004362, partial [Kitasatospora sp. MAP12-15]|uniref:hypothetical protein n=1 Tax=unclassified Kitasatospora TaxID=2633591 RepID=UPI003514C285
NPDPKIKAGDVNISGVDFWHAVEFSRNGRFLRTAFAVSPSASFSTSFRSSPSLSDPIRTVLPMLSSLHFLPS